MSRIIATRLLVIMLLAKFSAGSAQSASEVYLFELSQENGLYKLANPTNISSNPGYDNQPAFLNSEEMVYAATFDNQTDIVKFNFVTKEKVRLTNTPGSEFSPKPTPDGKYISAIILAKDGSQVLAKYPLKGGEPKIIPSKQKIGYYCWYDKKTVFSFVLGSPPSLQEWNTRNAQFKIIMMNPGRSLSRIPNQKTISFIHKESDDIWYVNSYDPSTDKVTYITECIKEAEDMTWSPDGTAFISNKQKIYKFNPTTDQSWKLVANMDSFNLSEASRLSISPDSKWMAVVIEE
ncbi:WD40-like Beta Propeller Repeat [Reichenbachiella faecimaris]|uniref:WD40-like Beta Propeller Repeat n=1 Tax=Reichenbachiella faecimaris TaxID=692418 RepID=A0A1W2GQK9_REIFA|nr:PD40 domain-containing protein [Reichenbachiella faecimaris]SMD38937.1 WD40-like Beta Propeller Repeat [Reichenbachiella faecimaris]